MVSLAADREGPPSLPLAEPKKRSFPKAGTKTSYEIPLSFGNAQYFADWYHSIHLASEEEAAWAEALSTTPAPCCDDNPVIKYCCQVDGRICNLTLLSSRVGQVTSGASRLYRSGDPDGGGGVAPVHRPQLLPHRGLLSRALRSTFGRQRLRVYRAHRYLFRSRRSSAVHPQRGFPTFGEVLTCRVGGENHPRGSSAGPSGRVESPLAQFVSSAAISQTAISYGFSSCVPITNFAPGGMGIL